MSQEPGQQEPASQPFGVPPSEQYGQYGQYGQPAPPPGDYGRYGQQPPPQGQYGQYGQPPGQGGYYGPGFVPTAAQPGIIPLRPLTLGEIYDGAFRAIRSNPLVMFGLAVIVIGAGSILQIALTVPFIGRVERAAQAGLVDFDAYFSVGSVAGILLSSAAVSLATLVLEGLAILSVSESVLGRRISLGEVWQRARGRLWRLVVLSLLLGVAGLVAVVGAGALVIVLAVAIAEVSGDGVLMLVVLVPVLFLLLAGVVAFFAVRLMLATCVIMLEGSGVLASVARSWRLTRGNFWRLFGIMLLTVVLVTILVSILSVPFSMVGSVLAIQDGILLPLVLSSIGQLVGSAVSIPVMAAVLALLYIDVRMRKEGLDVELARAAQGE